jgi:hypothetical protein
MVKMFVASRCNGSVLGLVIGLLAILPAESRADPYTYGFQCITNTSAGNAAIGESQLFVDVSDYGSTGGASPLNRVLFTFRNVGPLTSSISDVYFDDGTLLALADLIDEDQNGGLAGVDFTQRALAKVCPPDLPSGDDIHPPFDVTAGFSADSDNPTWSNGVNPGEWLGVIFTLQPGKNFDSIIDALELGLALTSTSDPTGSLRIGIHVQGFDNGGSESFINGEKVPLPAAVLLGLLGLGAAGIRLRKVA